MIQVDSINKSINGSLVMDSVSLTLNRGEILSVIGPSGAGKTTLLRAMSLIDFPDSGHIQIDGRLYSFPFSGEPRLILPYPKLTVVFQQLFIWPHLTIRENLTLPLGGQVKDLAHFDRLVDMFRMGAFLDRYPNQASIGERQRTALVRALLLKPDYLFLDEVTSALDIEQSQLIIDHLRDIANDGVGLFFISHAIHLAKKVSDRILFLDKGKIVEQGPPDMLKKPQSDRLKTFLSFSD